jgi:tetratricopeptide (TPR) repeat protein
VKRAARSFTARLALATALAATVGARSAGADPSAPSAQTVPPVAPSVAATAAASPQQAASTAVAAARQRVASGDLDGAIALLKLYVVAHPGSAEAGRYLGDLYYRQSDFVAAENAYLAILRVNPRDRETYNRLGGVYAAEDRVGEAIDAFTRSLPDTGSYGRLTALHRRKGDLAAFEDGLRGDAESQPENAAAQYAIGVVDHADRKYSEAAMYLSRALALDPTSCAALTELGSTDLDLGIASEAFSLFERCLGRDRDNYPALVDLGVARTQSGETAKARELFDHALRVRPEGAEAFVDLGFLDDLDGRWQSAVQYYLRALAYDPLARDAYLDLGYDYNEHGLYALAEAAFLKGLSASPDDGRLHYLLGVTYAGQGKRALARAEYERAARSDEPEVVRAANRDLASFGS